ncbi:MAG: isoaspartyl peptidase/L-asparaginase [Anaerolineae bacterium]
MGQPSIIVHGGAWDIPGELRHDAEQGCFEAAKIGWDALRAGQSAVQAVEAAVGALEDDSTFDAGRGSVLNAVGEIELDAIIMDGSDLALGAVMAVRHLNHPVTLARLIMADSEHNILVADGAEAFAREHGLTLVPNWHMIVQRERERWLARDAGDGSDPGLFPHRPAGTVGAVALDLEGHVAAATSTGGTFDKQPGRVGDSPLVGSGAYADDRTGAVSATGEGEDLMRIVISKLACDRLGQGMTAQASADSAIATLSERTGGLGGLIVLSRDGDIGIAHCTSCLAHAYVTPEGEVRAGVRA